MNRGEDSNNKVGVRSNSSTLTFDLTERDPKTIKEFIFKYWNFKENFKTVFYRKNGKFAVIDGLRAFAVFWVLAVHYMGYQSDLRFQDHEFREIREKSVSSLFFTWSKNGGLGVDIFFVLSGFLIAFMLLKSVSKSKDKKINISSFYFRRIVRIAPPLYAMMIVEIIPLKLFFSNVQSLASTLRGCDKYWWSTAFFFNNFIPSDFFDGCLMHTWSIAVEIQFYIISPIFIFFYLRSKSFGKKLLLTSILLATLTRFIFFESIGTYDDHRVYDIVYAKPYTRCVGYFTGMLSAILYLESIENDKLKLTTNTNTKTTTQSSTNTTTNITTNTKDDISTSTSISISNDHISNDEEMTTITSNIPTTDDEEDKPLLNRGRSTVPRSSNSQESNITEQSPSSLSQSSSSQFSSQSSFLSLPFISLIKKAYEWGQRISIKTRPFIWIGSTLTDIFINLFLLLGFIYWAFHGVHYEIINDNEESFATKLANIWNKVIGYTLFEAIIASLIYRSLRGDFPAFNYFFSAYVWYPLATVSYSAYLLHWIAVGFHTVIFGSDFGPYVSNWILRYIIWSSLTFFFALLMYLIIEKPFMDLRNFKFKAFINSRNETKKYSPINTQPQSEN